MPIPSVAGIREPIRSESEPLRIVIEAIVSGWLIRIRPAWAGDSPRPSSR